MFLAVFLLLVVYMLGENIGKLQYVYPVIGQHVEFTKDVHVISYRDSPTVLSYDRWTAMLEVDPSLKWGEDSRNDFVTQKGTFQSGNIGTVVRVERRSNGLSPSLAYVISVGGREIEISIQELHNHSFENKYEAASFCGKVKWEFCSETLQNGFFPDSMNPDIRRISNLVYFWIPVFFFGFVLEG